MSDLANRLPETVRERVPSPYARMILGARTTPFDGSLPSRVPRDFERKGARAIVGWRSRQQEGGWKWLRVLIPQPQTENLFVLYQLIVTDLVILTTLCLAPSLVSTRWSLPRPAIPVYAVLVTLFGFSEGLYSSSRSPISKIAVLVRSVGLSMLVVMVAVWKDLSPQAVLVALVSSLTALLLWRRLLAWHHRRSEARSHNVLIVGATPAGRAIARALRDDPQQRVLVRGFVDDLAPLSADILGRVEDLDWLARAEFVDEVIVALPNQSSLAREAADVACRNHLDIRAVPDLPPGAWPDACIDRIGDVPVVILHREPVPSLELLVKRFLDTAGAFVALLLALPLMALVAAAIRLDSPGPVFYSAQRTGAKGRRFPCHKFRSMAIDADARKRDLRARNQREGPTFKIENDPRITRVGRFIRRYSLDELPQLWNVLRGDMSLVGPRPHPVDDVNRYELHHYRRLDVKPGLTGLWQVTARQNPSFDLNMHLDLTYIENWTLFLDLRILLRTVRVLFAPEGA